MTTDEEYAVATEAIAFAAHAGARVAVDGAQASLDAGEPAVSISIVLGYCSDHDIDVPPELLAQVRHVYAGRDDIDARYIREDLAQFSVPA